ncbi:MAG: hypothetical protein Q8K75_10405 [Chlamydiales bacterium]|nr:hypothetical protein [Chlamydiales bacterium]
MEILEYSRNCYVDDFMQAAEQAQGAKQFKEIPKSYGIVLDIVREAFENFEQGNLYNFDPLVGDCCCQIRSLMMAEAFNDAAAIADIMDAKARVDAAKGQLEQMVIPTRGNVSLVSFLTEANRVQISERAQIIALSYLLTIVKQAAVKVELPDVINLTPLMQKGLSKGTAEKIVKKAQRVLSELSVKYVQEKALRLPDELQAMVTTPYVKTDKSGVQCQPFYYLTEVVLRSARERGVPIVLEVQRGEGKVEIPYMSNGEGYYISNQTPADMACMKVFGVASEQSDETLDDFRARLGTIDVLDIVRAGAANHPQYSAQIKDAPELPNDLEMQRYIDLADRMGCTRDNARTCLISHIYPIITKLNETAKDGC